MDDRTGVVVDGAGPEAGGEMDPGREHFQIAVPHVQQLHSWDCGLACAQMVLRKFSKDTQNFTEVCQKVGFNQSVWTIDLAVLLHEYQIKSHLCTITLGVDHGYKDQSFYQAEFTTEETRINALFKEAPQLGISIEKRHVQLDEILEHLSKGKVAIVLVDWNHLHCRWCGNMCLQSFCLIGNCFGHYQGHFVVISGFDRREGLLYFNNPAQSSEICCCSFQSFEKARTSYGTDEDILFIDQD